MFADEGKGFTKMLPTSRAMVTPFSVMQEGGLCLYGDVFDYGGSIVMDLIGQVAAKGARAGFSL